MLTLLDRPVDFYRARNTRCAACGHEEAFDLAWLEGWSHGDERCPACGVDCTEEDATCIIADQRDLALDDASVSSFSWWHTSTFPDWPSLSFAPAARLTEDTRRRMGSGGVERWSRRQLDKALHVGTYEAAIHNVLRRIRDQPEPDSRFYLCRVTLRPDVVVAKGCRGELVDWMGDVPLNDACPPGVDATRYVNQHEDAGGVSLALGREALLAVQRLEVPLAPSPRPDWWGTAVAELLRAATLPLRESPDDSAVLDRWRRPTAATSPVAKAQHELSRHLTLDLPVNLRDEVLAAVLGTETDDAEQWCDHLAGWLHLVDSPAEVICSVRAQTFEEVAQS